jgi:hypothetical protein
VCVNGFITVNIEPVAVAVIALTAAVQFANLRISLLCVSVITDAHDGSERAQANAASAHFTAHCTDRKLVVAFGCWLLCCAVCTAGTTTAPHLVRSLPSHHQGLRPEALVLPLLLLLLLLLLL